MAAILLIEPDLILGKTYASALRANGHEVILRHYAEASIFALDKNKPDVIVLELQLPGHGGVEFLHELRSYTEWQSIPVLLHTLVSTDRLQAQMARLMDLGIYEHLYKPATSLLQLVRAVNRATAT